MTARYIIQLIKVFVFYLLLFAACRSVFLLYFAKQVAQNGFGVFLQSLYQAIPLDVSTASYLLFIPLLILLFAQFFYAGWWMRVLQIYLVSTALLYTLVAMVEIGVYQELHVKLYFNLLSHLQHLDEIFRTVTFSLIFTVLLLVIVVSYIAWRIVKILFPIRNIERRSLGPFDIFRLIAAFTITGGLLVLGCRGGLRQIPINEGEVYFSDNQTVNDGTVNPLWSIVHSFIENGQVLKGNVYKVMPDQEADAIVNKLFSVEKDTTIHLFKAARPNVCILILESWSADLVASTGGYTGLTPNFEKLVSDGYLFTNLKPAGHISDQGIPAILSGYPALTLGSAINQPERQVDLPNINNQFSRAGYFSSFFYGGQLIFGNIKAYIYRNQFNRITEQQTLPSSLPAGRLGIHDSIMLGIWRDSMNTYRQPFLTCLFTLSTHMPFDAPGPMLVNWGDKNQEYLNSAMYADRQLGKFFEDAKKEKWYDSTIFILVADHSHGSPKNHPFVSPEFYHIPLLICGGALKDEFRGQKNGRICSQNDIASTLLHQLGFESSPYRWSKNLMNPYTEQFAFYTFEEGFGFVDTSGVVIWNKSFPSQNSNTGKTEEAKKSLYQKGAAMLQVLMNDFLAR